MTLFFLIDNRFHSAVFVIQIFLVFYGLSKVRFKGFVTRLFEKKKLAFLS